jgi:hypothetical protein
MDMLVDKSNREQQQAQYRALAERYRVRAESSPDTMLAAGYMNLANIYEVVAQTLGKPSDLSDRAE